MFFEKNRMMLLVTTAVGLGLASPALAQASDGQAGETVLQDIVVTARRTEERLQHVPISISVFDQEQLSRLNVTNLGLRSGSSERLQDHSEAVSTPRKHALTCASVAPLSARLWEEAHG